MATVDAIKYGQFIQYTGSSGAAFATAIGGQIVSEAGGVLSLGDPSTGTVMFVVNTGDWFNLREGSFWSDADFTAQHITKAAALLDTNTDSSAAVTALQASQATQGNTISGHTTTIGTHTLQIAALQSAVTAIVPGTSDIVSVSVPLLLLGGSADRVVTWARPFANANYNVSFATDANTIGRITPTVLAGTKTATGLTVRITAGLAVTVAGVVHVLGTT